MIAGGWKLHLIVQHYFPNASRRYRVSSVSLCRMRHVTQSLFQSHCWTFLYSWVNAGMGLWRGMFGSVTSTSFPGFVIFPGNEVALMSICYLCYRNAKNIHLTNLEQLQVNIGSRFSTWIQTEYAQMTLDGLHEFSSFSRVIQLFVDRMLRAVYRTRDIEWEWCLVSSLTCNFAFQLVISRQSLS